MNRESPGKEPDPRIVYAGIIDHPHHVSGRYPQMSLYDRAAQFAPFAALSGYHDLVSEEARLVGHRIRLSEEEISRLNRKLRVIARAAGRGAKPEVSVTYFIPDERKEGGRYETVTETVRKVDTAEEKIILEKKAGKSGAYKTIRFADILDIHGEPDNDPE